MSDIEDDLASKESDEGLVKKVKNYKEFMSDSGEEEAEDEEMEDEMFDESGEYESEEPSEEENSEAPELVPAHLIDPASTTKRIRTILNKVSEGNIDPMFKQLMEVVTELYP